MNKTAGDGAREYIKFLNQAIIDVQRLFDIELDDEMQMKLRLELNGAIGKIIDELEERNEATGRN